MKKRSSTTRPPRTPSRQNRPKKRENPRNNREFALKMQLRERVIVAVLCGMYSDIDKAQKFAAFTYGNLPVQELFARVAIAQADALLSIIN